MCHLWQAAVTPPPRLPDSRVQPEEVTVRLLVLVLPVIDVAASEARVPDMSSALSPSPGKQRKNFIRPQYKIHFR